MSSTVGAIQSLQRTSPDEGAVRQLFAAISLALLGLLVGLATILVLRRLSGALVQPLGGGALLLAALAVESTIALYRSFVPSTKYLVRSTLYFPRRPLLSPRVAFFLLLPGVAAFSILASLSIRETPAWGLLLAWIFLISAESFQWLLHFRPELVNVPWLAALRPLEHPVAELDQPEIPRGLVQQLTRTLEGDRESIHALVRANVAANDRLAVVHLSFCPPLSAPPRLSAHALDADDAEVRITQAETFGARLEVRLSAVKEVLRTVMVELLGSA